MSNIIFQLLPITVEVPVVLLGAASVTYIKFHFSQLQYYYNVSFSVRFPQICIFL